MLTVAPGGNNLATICYKEVATINMYYYYYYYYYYYVKVYENSEQAMKAKELFKTRKSEVTSDEFWCMRCFQ